MMAVANELRPNLMPDYVQYWLDKQHTGDNDPLGDSGTPASLLPENPEPPMEIWFGLYRGAVSYLAGETGAGKSSAIYNILIHAAQNKPLWDVPFGLGRPLKVWYLDPENAANQGAHKIRKIGAGRPEALVLDPAINTNLSDQQYQASFRQRIRRDKFDLVVLDPLLNLFSTANENDNAEGATQMAFLQAIAQDTGAAILSSRA